MGQTSINIRTDEELKKQFDAVCEEMGLTLSTAINIYMKTVVREREIPFKLTANKPSFMVDSMEELIEKLNEGILSEDAGTAEDMFEEMRRKYNFERV